MKTIIIGDKNIRNKRMLKTVIEEFAGWKITKVLTRGYVGIDRFAIQYAAENKIPHQIVGVYDTTPVILPKVMRDLTMMQQSDALIIVAKNLNDYSRFVNYFRKSGKAYYIEKLHLLP